MRLCPDRVEVAAVPTTAAIALELTCFLQSKEVFDTAEKILSKYNVFRFKLLCFSPDLT